MTSIYHFKSQIPRKPNYSLFQSYESTHGVQQDETERNHDVAYQGGKQAFEVGRLHLQWNILSKLYQ